MGSVRKTMFLRIWKEWRSGMRSSNHTWSMRFTTTDLLSAISVRRENHDR